MYEYASVYECVGAHVRMSVRARVSHKVTNMTKGSTNCLAVYVKPEMFRQRTFFHVDVC